MIYKTDIYNAQSGEQAPLPGGGLVSAKLRFAHFRREAGPALAAGDTVLLGKLDKGVRVLSHLSYVLAGAVAVPVGTKVQVIENGVARDVTAVTTAAVAAGALGLFPASTSATVAPTGGTDIQLAAATGVTDVTVVIAYIEGEDA
jgi:hypothetical protein